MNEEFTLCWTCANACGNCSWSDGTFTPVEGWEAEATQIRNRYEDGVIRMSNSFHVTKCPNFIDDTDRYNKRPNPSKDSGWHPNPIARQIMRTKIEYPEVVINTNMSDARKRIETLPLSELYERIETRLSGVERVIAKLTFIGKMRACDVAEIVFYTEDHIKREILPRIYKKLTT